MGLRYGELFAGAGGLSLGLHRAGWQSVFHAEIDPFARRVLQARFPGVPLYGDVAALTGAELAKHGPIDLLSGGSPCQDLSQAGRRAGIIDGERSNLFFQQVRLWEETGAPFLLWENVYGALTSQKGEDFRYVLSALVGADVGRAIDHKGRVLNWPGSGMVLGPAGSAAWRILDAQHWGPPQRRRRVFVLAARPGFPSPDEVLFEWEGLFGNSAAGVPAGEKAPRDPRGGAPDARGTRTDRSASAQVLSFNAHSNGEDLNRPDLAVTPTLTAGGEGTTGPAVVAVDMRHCTLSDVSMTVQGKGNSLNQVPCALTLDPVVFDTKQSGETADGVAPTLRAMAFDKSHMNGGGQLGVVQGTAIAISSDATCRSGENLTPTPDADGRVRIRPAGLGVARPGEPMFTLTASTPQHAVQSVELPCLAVEPAAHAISENPRAELRLTPYVRSVSTGGGKPGQGYPAGMSEGEEARVARMLAFGHYVEDGTASAMKARDYKDATDLVYTYYQGRFGVPRRLTPLECERLMDWEDGWTDVPSEDGKPASDSARYRACGNGVVSACVEWIGLRLRERLEADRLRRMNLQPDGTCARHGIDHCLACRTTTKAA